MQDMYMRGNSRRNALQVYVEHNAVVRGMMSERQGDLLEWQPGDGWGPLCAFLGVDVPDVEFPHENQTEAFLRTVEGYFGPRLGRARRNLRVLVGVVVVLVECGVWRRRWVSGWRRWLAFVVGKHGGIQWLRGWVKP